MHHRACFIVALLLPLVSLHLGAQELRDPTVAPPESNAVPAANPTMGLPGAEGMAVIVRDGKSYLVVGTRLYAPGEKVGQTRVERITETEVWLRDGRGLRKVPRFVGIQRSVAKSLPACGASARKTSRTPKTAPAFKTPMSGKVAQSSAKAPQGAKASASSSNASKVAPCDGAQP